MRSSSQIRSLLQLGQKMASPLPKVPAQQFYRRVLPETCISFCSPEGKAIFSEALQSGHMEGYFGLAAQFRTQDEPAFCGLSTLVMVLNTLQIDPKRVWKGPWRWYHENMLECCTPIENVLTQGITMDQFACLAACNTLNVHMVRANNSASESDFRDIVKTSTQGENQIVTVSYSRRVLGQTGEGHFSPVAGYHKNRDLVLIMDTARFKYPPHWVKLPCLFEAMKALDKDTGLPRGYFILSKADTELQLVFRICPSLSIQSVASPQTTSITKEILAAASSWQQSLSQPWHGDNTELVKNTLEDLKSTICNTSKCDMLITIKADVECTRDAITVEHLCAVKEVVTALEELSLYNQVVESLGENAGTRCGQNCTTKLKSCSCDNKKSLDLEAQQVISKLTLGHCFTMILLAWPYMKCPTSKAAALQALVTKQLSNTSQMLQNETLQLKKQLASIFGYAEKCNTCGQREKGSCH